MKPVLTQNSKLTPAVFLDKDGTLIEDVPYNVDVEKIRLCEGVVAGLQLLHAANYRLFVITNQSGIARGYFLETALVAVEQHLRQLLAAVGVPLAGFYYCPHHPEGVVQSYAISCDCRKPQPGLLQKAAREHNIDLTQSWFIGDILHDIGAGRAAGCRTILIDNGNETEWQLSRQRLPHHVVANLTEAAQVIVGVGSNIQRRGRWGGGEVGRWGDGAMGRQEGQEAEVAQSSSLFPTSPLHSSPTSPLHSSPFQLIDAWKSLTVLVIGDVMLDSYLNGSADRLCQEAPVPVVAITHCQDFPGGAANTAANVTSLGGKVLLLSVVGDDLKSSRLGTALEQQGVKTEHLLLCSDRATLLKQRVLAESHLLVRFDQGSTEAIHPEIEQQVINRLIALFPSCDAVIISDYGYGILTPRVIQILAELQAQHPRILVADSKQLETYRDVKVTAVKPNYKQAIQLLELPKQVERRGEQIAPYGDRLLDLTGAAIAAVTLDSEGAIIFERGQTPCRIYAQPVPHNQTSGAGDTFVSTLTLALTAGAPTNTAASLAAAATAIVVTQTGTTTCNAEELRLLVGDC